MILARRGSDPAEPAIWEFSGSRALSTTSIKFFTAFEKAVDSTPGLEVARAATFPPYNVPSWAGGVATRQRRISATFNGCHGGGQHLDQLLDGYDDDIAGRRSGSRSRFGGSRARPHARGSGFRNKFGSAPGAARRLQHRVLAVLRGCVARGLEARLRARLARATPRPPAPCCLVERAAAEEEDAAAAPAVPVYGAHRPAEDYAAHRVFAPARCMAGDCALRRAGTTDASAFCLTTPMCGTLRLHCAVTGTTLLLWLPARLHGRADRSGRRASSATTLYPWASDLRDYVASSTTSLLPLVGSLRSAG